MILFPGRGMAGALPPALLYEQRGVQASRSGTTLGESISVGSGLLTVRPYGEPWRLGADEATAILMPTPATIGDVAVGPGWYTLYAVPGEREWRIVVNGKLRRWGVPIDDDVRSEDVGSTCAIVRSTEGPLELLTMRFDRTSASAADLVIEWDRTGVRVPILLHPEAANPECGGAP
jgi:hypothetical protein